MQEENKYEEPVPPVDEIALLNLGDQINNEDDGWEPKRQNDLTQINEAHEDSGS